MESLLSFAYFDDPDSGQRMTGLPLNLHDQGNKMPRSILIRNKSPHPMNASERIEGDGLRGFSPDRFFVANSHSRPTRSWRRGVSFLSGKSMESDWTKKTGSGHCIRSCSFLVDLS
jgi:hypothetical protein